MDKYKVVRRALLLATAKADKFKMKGKARDNYLAKVKLTALHEVNGLVPRGQTCRMVKW